MKKIVDRSKQKQRELKTCMGRPYLPFTKKEKKYLGIQIVLFLLLFFTIIYQAYAKNKTLPLFVTLVGVLLSWQFFYSISRRFFSAVYTSLPLHKNIEIVEDIAMKQLSIAYSLEKTGLYTFEYDAKNKGIETLVVFCENGRILINNYHTKTFYAFPSQNMKYMKKLIAIRSRKFR